MSPKRSHLRMIIPTDPRADPRILGGGSGSSFQTDKQNKTSGGGGVQQFFKGGEDPRKGRPVGIFKLTSKTI